MYSAVGTPNYIAPEVIKKLGYNEKCDIWSLGILLYTMLAGFPPFYIEDGQDVEVLYSKIVAGVFSFPEKIWKNVSNQAKLLIKDLLQLDPKARPTASEILENDWFEMFCYGEHNAPSLGFDNDTFVNFNRKRLTMNNLS